MMSLKNIDEEVISITLSDPKVEEVQYLLNSNVLNNSEEKLLERFLECSGLYGISKIKELLAEYKEKEKKKMILYIKNYLKIQIMMLWEKKQLTL